MSHKQAKKLRQQQRMEQKQQQYSIQHLENFIALCNMLTGQKPTEIVLTESYYAWYLQEAQRHADVLGLNLGFKNDQPTFNGIKLMKREKPIEVAK